LSVFLLLICTIFGGAYTTTTTTTQQQQHNLFKYKMSDSTYLIYSKKEVKRILAIGTLSLFLAWGGIALWPMDLLEKIIVGFFELLLIFQTTKVPRYWTAFNSEDIEIISKENSRKHMSKLTTLPFGISAIFIVLCVLSYWAWAILAIEFNKILLGAAVLMVLFLPGRVIMFNFSNKCFYGLWTAKSFYDSDRQSMNKVRIEYFGEDSIDRVRITDKSGYYDIHKKEFSNPAWERIILNLNRIDEINSFQSR
jgi:hypothetical protein